MPQYTVILVSGEDGSVGRHDCITLNEVYNWITKASLLGSAVLSVTIINNFKVQ